MSKKRNNRGEDKDGGEPAMTTKSGKNQRAKTLNASTTESTIPNATNLGVVFDEAANNNDAAALENSFVPDAPATDAVEDQQQVGVGESNTSNIIDSAIPPDVNVVDTHSTTDSITTPTTNNESHLEPYNYDLPFTIFDRFIASDCPWTVDKQPSNAQQLFSASGERRRKEVKDDFEWTRPTPRPADLAAARDAYSSKYSFIDGIQMKDPRMSSCHYRIPSSVAPRYNPETHSVAISHPLAMVEQDIHWLTKPVGNLLDRIQSSAKRGYTRSTLNDARMGKDLFISSAFCNANDFVCSSDDIELVDFVQHDSAKKVWHCSNLLRSEMLSNAIITAYKAAVDGDTRFNTVPLWLSIIQSTRSQSATMTPIQFLGFVSLYETKSGNKVAAFRLHTFLLYSWDARTKSTRVHLLLSEHRMTPTSAPERMLQLLQLVQSDHVQSTSIYFVPEFILSDVSDTYTFWGFSKKISSKHKGSTVFRRQSVLKLSKFSNRIMWGRNGSNLSMITDHDFEPDGFDSIFQMQCRLVSQLLYRPLSADGAIGVRFETNVIHERISMIASGNGIADNIELCAQTVRNLATEMTRIPLAAITHATMARMYSVKGSGPKKHVYETTLELLQYVSVAMVSVEAYFHAFVGDCHTCVLFCEKCQKQFGRIGDIFQVMSEAPHAILYHHGLELTECEGKEDDNDDLEESRFSVSLPIHPSTDGMGAFSLSMIKTFNSMPSQRCTYGCGSNHFSKSHDQNSHDKNFHYMHNLDEAMRIDSYLA